MAARWHPPLYLRPNKEAIIVIFRGICTTYKTSQPHPQINPITSKHCQNSRSSQPHHESTPNYIWISVSFIMKAGPATYGSSEFHHESRPDHIWKQWASSWEQPWPYMEAVSFITRAAPTTYGSSKLHHESSPDHISMAQCDTAVTPLLTHWSNCSLTLSHRYGSSKLHHKSCLDHIWKQWASSWNQPRPHMEAACIDDLFQMLL